MSSLLATAPAVNTQTRPAEFIVPDVSAYMLGVLDAEKGEIACPEMYFIKLGDQIEYCEGYHAVRGATLTTAQFLGGKAPRPILTDAEIAAEADDLEEAMLDEMFNRRGAW